MGGLPEPDPEERARLYDPAIGRVVLRVSDLERQADFYAQAIGLARSDADPTTAELAGPNGDVLLILDSADAAGSDPAPQPYAGLFHVAYRFPDRASLANAVKRTADLAPLYEGASDHGVSEAVYFRDPEGNGIELYRDRTFEEWPAAEDGQVAMYSQPLDLTALVAESDSSASTDLDVGHVHLQVSDVGGALAFWRDVVGLDERQRFGPQAIFLADGLYHHHVGANSWHSAGASPLPADRPGLAGFDLDLRSSEAVDQALARAEAAGAQVDQDSGSSAIADPDGNWIRLRSR